MKRRLRIPISKSYRAFPELDRFSDAECREIVASVARRHRLSNALSIVLLVPVFFVLVFGGIVGVMVANEWAHRQFPRSALVERGWLLVPSLCLVVVLPMLFAQYCRHAWVRGKLRSHVSTVRCAACDYSLLGLPVVNVGITCPECGQRFDLAARGLTAADVLSGTASESET